MSITIIAAPVSLGYVLVTTLVSALSANVVSEASTSISTINNTTASQSLDTISVNKDDIEQVCKEYKTVIADRDLLLKTLQERGVDNLSVKDDSIYTKISEFNLLFTRQNEGETYNLKVFMSCDTDSQELVNEIFGEYCINTQESTYEKIVSRLESQNLQIDEEEVLDDNSIMLTINLN